ncbi:hypothetical protein KUI_0125 [Taylorella equigenitalis ATCC 35865]|uniref:Uncharacterized protein n=2 Tax=Taylorella equigenitalis TaxID=29575 RepID=A0ABN4ATQ5_9BURK|nr:hypothetical protein KUI_0125 [Taylorella equigenitalis ATCC 35865]
MLSFVDLKVSELNWGMGKYTFTFNGKCDDIVVDYYHQKLFPLDYFREKIKNK